MKTQNKIIVLALCLGVAAVSLPARAQTPAPPTVFASLQNLLDARDTNSLMHAGEINVSPLFKWNAHARTAGGAMKLDWWVTDQQGAFFGFEEYAGGRASYWSVGYQARTVFKGLEFSLGLGTRQNTDNSFGDVTLFLTPTITKQIYANGNWDIRLAFGCDVVNGATPNPFLGVVFRAVR